MTQLYKIQYAEGKKFSLPDREGVLRICVEEWEFPTEDHKKVFDLLYKETVDEMKDLGLVPFDENFEWGIDP